MSGYTRKWLKSKIGEVFTEYMLDNGYLLSSKNMDYYKIDGDIVNVVNVYSGRNIHCFYMLYYCNLLCNPLGECIGPYSIGERLSRNPVNDNIWTNDRGDKDGAMEILDDMFCLVRDVIVPGQRGLNDYKSFFIENYSVGHSLVHNKINNIICMERLGKKYKASSLCEELISYIKNSTMFSDDKKREYIILAKELRGGVNTGNLDRLLDEWRKKSLAEIESLNS